MKKKIFRIIAITFIILIFLILICTRINKIPIIENIKQTAKVGENTSKTTIDVTYLEDNENLGHDHIFKTMYDEIKHWNECTVCGKRENETGHSYTDNGWLYGNSCKQGNVHKYSCICGHSYTTNVGKPNHNLSNTENSTTRYSLENHCTNIGCGYINIIHYCKKSDGTKINCGNLGTCSICGKNYNTNNSVHLSMVSGYQGNGEINEQQANCLVCKTNLGKINYLRIIRKNITEYTLQCKITLASGINYYYSADNDLLGGNHSVYKNSTTTGSTCTFERTIKFNEYLEDGGGYQFNVLGKKNGMVYHIAAAVLINKLDQVEPIISKITMQEQEELTEWSKTKPIIVSGTENYCKSVTVKIIDENENIVFEGKGSVNNPSDSNYSVSCIPELEVDTKGKTFTAIVTDSCGNTTEQEFTIAKVDAIPPTPTSGKEILGDWAKSKEFTFTATDYGIGQVSIAFNDVQDLELANVDYNTYSRDYTFTGDVYIQKQLSVIYKDGLGNTSMQKITIDKLDNTAPTITNTSIHNDIITIDAHDRHEILGEGSGVVKYRYLASGEKLNNPELNSGNSIESTEKEITIKDIYKIKYIYVVAEDYVGNTSKVYEFKVPELILTSSVNLNTANGKGEIILDWSSYDISDKYFVVYRKKDSQTDWEEIVPLTQKLTGNTYTDKLGNDGAKPNVPTININGDTSNNNINVTVSSTDNGTNYKYYIEAYSSIGTLLSKSN